MVFDISIKQVYIYYLLTAALPLTARDVNRTHLSTTITRKDAGVEPPWMALRRVDDGCVRFMSRISATLIQARYISLFGYFLFVNGTAVLFTDKYVS